MLQVHPLMLRMKVLRGFVAFFIVAVGLEWVRGEEAFENGPRQSSTGPSGGTRKVNDSLVATTAPETEQESIHAYEPKHNEEHIFTRIRRQFSCPNSAVCDYHCKSRGLPGGKCRHFFKCTCNK
ncbi:uncharacterized protein LOC144137561 [Haemaphysalis longicornis]